MHSPWEVAVDRQRRPGLDVAVRVGLSDLLELPDVTRVGLALTEGGGRRLLFTATDRFEGRQLSWCHIDAYDDVPLTEVVSSGRPVRGGLDEVGRRYPSLVALQRALGTTAMAALPLPGQGSAPMGGVMVYLAGPAAVDDELTSVLEQRTAQLADLVAGAQALSPRRATSLADVPVPEGARVADTEAVGGTQAAGQARRFVRSTLAGWGVHPDAVDTAELGVSELVTNAVVHAGSPSEVRTLLDGGALTVTVRDRGAQTALVRPAPGDRIDAMRVHGRGLQLVEALSREWGAELDAAGATVWFRLDA